MATSSSERPLRLLRTAIFALTFLVAVAHADAAGTDHPPRASLRVDGQVAKAREGTYEWTRRRGDVCISEAAQGSGDMRQQALVITSGVHQGVLRIDRAVRPRTVRIYGWRELDQQTGRPIGDAEKFPVELRPAERRGGREIWKATFTFDLPSDDLYLDVYAKWAPFQGCPQ